MTSRERPSDRAVRRTRRSLIEIGDELARARREAGLSQLTVAAASGLSRSQVSRIERADHASVSLMDLGKVLAVAGLQLWVRAYPAGDAVRDAAHVATTERFLEHVKPPLTWRTEVPLPNAGDLRAWDLTVRGPDARAGVEVENRLTDFQSLERRLGRKRRDGAVDLVILVLADTRANRRAARGCLTLLRESFPTRGRAVSAALQNGRLPATDALLFV